MPRSGFLYMKCVMKRNFVHIFASDRFLYTLEKITFELARILYMYVKGILYMFFSNTGILYMAFTRILYMFRKVQGVPEFLT